MMKNKIYGNIRKNAKHKTHFALVLSKSGIISKYEIWKITRKTGLLPLFFALSSGEDISYARFLSRMFDAKIVKPHDCREFLISADCCAFSICEKRWGADFSVNCGLPTYISADSTELRRYIGEAAAKGRGGFIIPFLKADIPI